jgi:hypothetical protein
MRDGRGNPFMEHREIKDCNIQPDPAVTEWKLGHVPKKIPLENSKGIFCIIITTEKLMLRHCSRLLLSQRHLYSQDTKIYYTENE